MLKDILASRHARKQWLSQHPEPALTYSWLSDFVPHLKARWRKQTPLDRAEPWMCFAAIDHLETHTKPEHRVLEYGSGGSTLFFSARCQQVVTIEHDGQWAQKVQDTLTQKQIQNVKLLHVNPHEPANAEEADPYTGYGSTDELFEKMSFKAYVEAGKQPLTPQYDIISVDGRARPACIRMALELIAPGGLLVVDNAEREHYNLENEHLLKQGWKCTQAAGPAMGFWHWTMTRFWQHPAGV